LFIKKVCNSAKAFWLSSVSVAIASGVLALSLETCHCFGAPSVGTKSGPGYGPNCEASGSLASCAGCERPKSILENSEGVGIVYPHFSVEGLALFERAIAAAKIDGFFNFTGRLSFESTLGRGCCTCGIAGAEVLSVVAGSLKFPCPIMLEIPGVLTMLSLR
jgi:hypothetical protein